MIFFAASIFCATFAPLRDLGLLWGLLVAEVLRKFGFLLFPLQSCVKVEGFADKAACSKLVKKLSVLFVIE